jgi:arsenite methyltransferase
VTDTAAAKSCCADLYAGDWARLLLGDSLHPGGRALTERLGELLGLGPAAQVLDVAAGRGVSALWLGGRFGCRVVGVDYSPVSASQARDAARQAGLGDRVWFLAGDAERLPFAEAGFDAVICECAFCTFPNKAVAAAELASVLRPGGWLGLADIVRRGPLPAGLDDLLAWIACVADARPPDEYVQYVEAAGLGVVTVEDHDQALMELVRAVRLRLTAAHVALRLQQLAPSSVDLARATDLARAAERAVAEGALGYTLIVASKPG